MAKARRFSDNSGGGGIVRGTATASRPSQFAIARAANRSSQNKRDAARKKRAGTTSSEAAAGKLNSEVRAARRARVAAGNA